MINLFKVVMVFLSILHEIVMKIKTELQGIFCSIERFMYAKTRLSLFVDFLTQVKHPEQSKKIHFYKN